MRDHSAPARAGGVVELSPTPLIAFKVGSTSSVGQPRPEEGTPPTAENSSRRPKGSTDSAAELAAPVTVSPENAIDTDLDVPVVGAWTSVRPPGWGAVCLVAVPVDRPAG